MGVTLADIRREALSLPRAYEALVRGRVKFRVQSLVFASVSKDETLMGFGFPKDERDALVEAEPHKFLMPEPVDMRYHWARVRLEAIDEDELAEIVFHAWRMVVPKGLARDVALKQGFVILDE
ncbi:MAG: MmcQ/YjbR family DNA-binding protein [Acidimicrobiales bacterium]|nr:MmcQ/YjbR family DNA-binding protein [Acidimicrobiales bacterium]